LGGKEEPGARGDRDGNTIGGLNRRKTEEKKIRRGSRKNQRPAGTKKGGGKCESVGGPERGKTNEKTDKASPEGKPCFQAERKGQTPSHRQKNQKGRHKGSADTHVRTSRKKAGD